MLYLPFSNRRFYLSDDKIYQTKTNTEVAVKDGSCEIAWLDGLKKYPFELLVYFCKKKPLADHLMMSVKILFCDGDKTNLDYDNLIYDFITPQEAIGFEGFFHIPGFANYAINRNGVMVNVTTGKTKAWCVTKPNKKRNSLGGYRYSGVVNDEGCYTNIFRHRALAMVFFGIPDTGETLVVNHKNGRPGDDDLSNLEWTTFGENNQHAYDAGLRGNAAKAILVKNLLTGEVVRHPSVKRAAEACGYPTGTFIYYRMRDNPNGVFSDNLMFKFDDGSEWPEPNYNTILLAHNSRPVMAYDVLANQVKIAESASSMAKIIGATADDVSRYARKNLDKLLNGHYIRYHQGIPELPVYSEEVRAVLKENGCRDGFMLKAFDGEIVVFTGLVSDFAKKFGFGLSTCYAALKNGKQVGKYKVERLLSSP